jgi:hypothetical protein
VKVACFGAAAPSACRARAAAGCDDDPVWAIRHDRKAGSLNLIHAIVPAADHQGGRMDGARQGGTLTRRVSSAGRTGVSKAGMMMFPAGNAIYRRETFDTIRRRAPS